MLAFISLNDAKIEKQAKEGNKKAKQIKKLTENTSSFLSTIQIGVTLAGFLTSATAAQSFAEMLDGHGGIYSITLDSTAGLVKTYKITYADNTYSYFTVNDGEQGLQGLQTYVHIRYSATYPVQTILTPPNNYIGIYTGTSSTAPTNSAQYTWFLWKGQQGDTGVSITSIVKTSTSGNVVNSTLFFPIVNTPSCNTPVGINSPTISGNVISGLS